MFEWWTRSIKYLQRRNYVVCNSINNLIINCAFLFLYLVHNLEIYVYIFYSITNLISYPVCDIKLKKQQQIVSGSVSEWLLILVFSIVHKIDS